MGLPPYKGAVTTLNDQSIKRIIPPPVGKAGFEVWVLTQGGLVNVNMCMVSPYTNLKVRAHLLFGEVR